jgi:hypothetical protein
MAGSCSDCDEEIVTELTTMYPEASTGVRSSVPVLTSLRSISNRRRNNKASPPGSIHQVDEDASSQVGITTTCGLASCWGNCKACLFDGARRGETWANVHAAVEQLQLAAVGIVAYLLRHFFTSSGGGNSEHHRRRSTTEHGFGEGKQGTYRERRESRTNLETGREERQRKRRASRSRRGSASPSNNSE